MQGPHPAGRTLAPEAMRVSYAFWMGMRASSSLGGSGVDILTLFGPDTCGTPEGGKVKHKVRRV